MKKLEHEYVFNYYANENYVMHNIYQGSKYKDKLTCPMGHEIELRFNDFQQGHGCRQCAGTEKHSHEYVYNYYKEHAYTMNSIYKHTKHKDSLICPVGHEIKMRFNNFQQGSRCLTCSGSEKHSHDYVYNYYKEHNYIMNSIYNNSQTKDQLTCPVGHNIKIKFHNFKQGTRCIKCAGVEKLSHEYVLNSYAKENYTMKSIYNGMSKKDKLICPMGHEIEMTYNHFKQGTRCVKCHIEKYSGENNSNWNPNREEISLNQRLRKTFRNNWITKHMKDDPNYNNFLLNPDAYTVDHIIPVKLFCELTIRYNLNEYKIKNIINHRDNLQLLTVKENSIKWYKGSSLFEAANYLVNNGIQFENFQTIAV